MAILKLILRLEKIFKMQLARGGYNSLDERLESKANADDVYSAEEADEHFLSAVEPGGSVRTENIVNKAVNEDKLSNEVVEKINSKLDESKIGSQISTITTNATAGAEVGFVVNDKKWLKDTVIKITVSAEENVISDKMTLGVKYPGDTNYTRIATPLVNEESSSFLLIA